MESPLSLFYKNQNRTKENHSNKTLNETKMPYKEIVYTNQLENISPKEMTSSMICFTKTKSIAF